MLVLSRKTKEQIVIGQDIVITVLEIRADRVRLGITAPGSTPVHRAEIWHRIQSEQSAGTFATVCNDPECYAQICAIP